MIRKRLFDKVFSLLGRFYVYALIREKSEKPKNRENKFELLVK